MARPEHREAGRPAVDMQNGVQPAAVPDEIGVVVDEDGATVLSGHPSLPLPELAHERRIAACVERVAQPIGAAVHAVEQIQGEADPRQGGGDIGDPRGPAEGREMMPLVPPAPEIGAQEGLPRAVDERPVEVPSDRRVVVQQRMERARHRRPDKRSAPATITEKPRPNAHPRTKPEL